MRGDGPTRTIGGRPIEGAMGIRAAVNGGEVPALCPSGRARWFGARQLFDAMCG
jgi:hypothetical protein